MEENRNGVRLTIESEMKQKKGDYNVRKNIHEENESV